MKASKTILLWAAFIFIPLSLHAVNCNSIITADEASVLLSDTHALNQAASTLIDQGIDPHVITIASMANYGNSLKGAMAIYAGSCPTWMGAGTTFKPNLLVLIVAPKDRKKNAFFGSALSPAFGSKGDVDYVYSQAANPYFKSGDFAGGFAAAFRDFGAKNVAYHDQQKHPQVKQTVVNNQATDLHGLWVILGWIVVISVITLAVFFLFHLFLRRKQESDAVEAAQGDAIDARTEATNAYNSIPSPSAAQTKLFADLSGSIKNDPTVDGLSEAEYRRIQHAWENSYIPEAGSEYPPTKSADPLPRHINQRVEDAPVNPNPTYYSQAPVTQTTIIHERDSDDGFATGVLVGDMISERNERRRESDYEPPIYREREPAPTPVNDDSGWSVSSSSNDDNSGDDSSFSSSDDSSSSNDSGDDSSF